MILLTTKLGTNIHFYFDPGTNGIILCALLMTASVQKRTFGAYCTYITCILSMSDVSLLHDALRRYSAHGQRTCEGIARRRG